ncbi:CAF17-like 4Fe-4S cluster assembly/insertion protein YgfZ [Lysobacter sp. CA199]|uniref:CAF17-like 4Fe-4S cluster assembly/insertion protein YgfZ n=1 Tax=Lysobacter sp. CA199 TaxID=3455608 RepID=UPI003F8D8EF8
MPDNPQALPGQAFALPDHRVIALEGRDAAAFAQAQFMNDVKALADGHWQWSGWLTPKGRVIALFALLRVSDQSIRLLLPDSDAAAMVQSLKRFVFRSKIWIDLREDLVIEGRYGVPEQGKRAKIGGDEASGLELDVGGEGGARTLRIAPAGPAAETDAQALARWTLDDLRHGLPRLPASQTGQWTPQQLSLERLNAFSVKKGCYPGQEIVARTHFLGKAKRGLVLFESPVEVAAGAEVRGEAAVLGTVASSASLGSTHLALAVLSLDRTEGPTSIDGHAVSEQPLLAGLER